MRTTFTLVSLLKKGGGVGCGQMEKGGELLDSGEVIPNEDASKAMRPWSSVAEIGDEARMKVRNGRKSFTEHKKWSLGTMKAGDKQS